MSRSGRWGLLAPLILGLASSASGMADETQVLSPDGQVRFTVLLREGRLNYGVVFRDKPAIETSPMRFTVDGVDLADGVEVAGAEPYQVDETYAWRGAHAQAVNRGSGARVSVRHVASRARYILEVRAYNDGVAFRHIVPGGGGERVPDEDTAFVIPAGSTAWYHDLGGHYEGTYGKKDIADVQAGDWAAPPLTFRLPGGAGYASITEAALENYSGMALQADGRRGFRVGLGHKHPVAYPYKLRYGDAEAQRLSRPAAVAGTITSPWRVVMVGPDLNALVNCDVVPNLCPPPDPRLFPKGAATEWVRPGRAVWKYLDGGANTLEEMKGFCRLAGELGFEYNVIEGFWQRWSDAALRDLVAYGRERHVGLWLWRHSKELRDPDTRRAFFKKCRDLGVAGVKLDFFDHEAKEVIDFYHVLLREAAENQLMVNFHGSNKPTGEGRTWPNELTREAVRGMESSRLQARARHDVTLPFTRLLAGPADYTPVHFGARRGDTSWAHQVASAAILASPLLTYGAHPANILKNPGVEMMKSVPSVWDETIVLPPSEIGEVAVFARRSAATWFLAVMNGPAARTVKVPLSFLGEGDYRALLIRDAPDDAAALRVENATQKRSDVLAIELREGGGFIARFSAN